MASYPNVNAANKYARDVVGGRIPACREVKQACQRHLEDAKAAKSRSYPYRFDREAAERAAIFIQLLPHTKGRWAREKQLITLEPWQLFIVCAIFGWLHKKSGLRRFSEAYIEAEERQIGAGRGHRQLHARRGWRVRRRGLLRRHHREAGLGGVPAGSADAPARPW